MSSYIDAKNAVLSAANGVDYTYRSTGSASGAPPLVALQHFRGNLDNWGQRRQRPHDPPALLTNQGADIRCR